MDSDDEDGNPISSSRNKFMNSKPINKVVQQFRQNREMDLQQENELRNEKQREELKRFEETHTPSTRVKQYTKEEYYKPQVSKINPEKNDKLFDPMINSAKNWFNQKKAGAAKMLGLRIPADALNAIKVPLNQAYYHANKQLLVDKQNISNTNTFQRLFDFSKSSFAQKIYCIIGILLIGLIYKLAATDTNSIRNNFLSYCVWTWIFLLIAMVVINYGYRLVFQ